MPNLFITFSPDNEVWNVEKVFNLADELFNNTLSSLCNDMWLVSSYGENGTHLHFHIHLIKCQCSSKTIRRHIHKVIEKGEYPKDRYMARVEAQRGNNTQMFDYMTENLEQNDEEKLCLNYKTLGYDEEIDSQREYDKQLSAGQYYNLFVKKAETLRAKNGSLCSNDLQGIYVDIATNYHLFKIDDRCMDRMTEELKDKFCGWKHSRRVSFV